jgi:peptidyl-dipeptidase A
MTSAAEDLAASYESRLRPLYREASLAWWDANTHSSDENDRRKAEAELALSAVYADREGYAALRDMLAHAEHDRMDPLLTRQLRVLANDATPHQVPEDLRKRIIDLESSVASTFNTFRGSVAGRPVNDNDIEIVLRQSDDTAERRAHWMAAKEVGAEVADRVRALARLRNEAARLLGYRDHYEMALSVGELDEPRLFRTLDEVDAATAKPFGDWKAALDARLVERFGIAVSDLRPWHYEDPFFQDAPKTGELDLDAVFAPADVEALTVRTYDGLGLDIRPALARSDLHARDGKNQHAFCVDIDREGDVRVLCNVVPNERWMGTMLHEFGHGIYDLEIDRDLPWILRSHPHSLATEGVAMLGGRLVHDPEWLEIVAGVAPDDAEKLRPDLAGTQRASLLVFARWVLVMTHFERGLYADPEGDHDARWWDLVERFQQLRRPDARAAPDWAAKIHVAVVPVYYQNYLYGELVASQLEQHIRGMALGLVDRPVAGRFLVDGVFAPGASERWDRLIERATGHPLSVKPLVAQLTAH